MEANYKIQTAFISDSVNNPFPINYASGHYFWRLIKTSEPDDVLNSKTSVEESFYIFPSLQSTPPSIHSDTSEDFSNNADSFQRWHVYCLNHTMMPNSLEPDQMYTVYGDAQEENDAKFRWENAKFHLGKHPHLLIKNKEYPTPILQNIVRNNFYSSVANLLKIDKHVFSKDVLPTQPYFCEWEPALTFNRKTFTKKNYSIQAAVAPISINIAGYPFYSNPPAGHHFWILTERYYGQEKIIEAMHGLATQYKTNKAGNKQPYIASLFGSWNSQLKAYCIPAPQKHGDTHEHYLTPSNKNYWIMPEATHTVHEDNSEKHEALANWNQAKHALQYLNALNVAYSFCGLGKTFGFFKCKNSNSTYSTIAALMELEAYRFKGYLAPGINTPLLSKSAISHLANHCRSLTK